MAHLTQQRWLCVQRALYPEYFKNVLVFDIGSADICGNNHFLFSDYVYRGFDVMPYKNVTDVGEFHIGRGFADVVISTEMLEHSPTYMDDICKMVQSNPQMLIITCAIDPRKRHGTDDTTPVGSPFKGISYYKNINPSALLSVVRPNFKYVKWVIDRGIGDFYMIAFREEPNFSPSILTYLRLYFYVFYLNRLRDFKNWFNKYAGFYHNRKLRG